MLSHASARRSASSRPPPPPPPPPASRAAPADSCSHEISASITPCRYSCSGRTARAPDSAQVICTRSDVHAHGSSAFLILLDNRVNACDCHITDSGRCL
ncbi:hypothetical protein SRHO_G00142210 [Serrasalmus rhombeus]